jgi:hypothetical protein
VAEMIGILFRPSHAPSRRENVPSKKHISPNLMYQILSVTGLSADFAVIHPTCNVRQDFLPVAGHPWAHRVSIHWGKHGFLIRGLKTGRGRQHSGKRISKSLISAPCGMNTVNLISSLTTGFVKSRKTSWMHGRHDADRPCTREMLFNR